MNWSSAAERTLEQMLDGSGRISIVTVNGRAAPSLSPSGQGRIYFDSSSNTFKVSQNGGAYADLGTGGAGAPAAAKYLVQVADAALPNAQAMGALATGLVFNTTTTGVQSIYTTSGTGTTVALTDSPTFTTKILVPSGVVGAPSLAFSAEPTTGIYRTGASDISFAVLGVRVFSHNNADFTILSNDARIRMGSSNDVVLSRFAAANWQLGTAATATPIAQTLSAQDGVGTDIAGTVWTLRANRATGAGTPGTIVLAASAAALGTGATLQTAVTHLTVGGGTVTSAMPILVPDGTAAAPSMAWASQTNTGFFRLTADDISLSINGTRRFSFTADDFYLLTATPRIIFGTGVDTVLMRFAVANFQLGRAAAASPVAQTLSVQDGAGTDIAGTVWTLRANRATGAGAPGTIVLAASAAALGTGTTLQTAVTHLTIGNSVVKLGASVNLQQSNGTVRITDGGVFRSSDNSAGVTAGPFTAITGITVKDGIVTALTGT